MKTFIADADGLRIARSIQRRPLQHRWNSQSAQLSIFKHSHDFVCLFPFMKLRGVFGEWITRSDDLDDGVEQLKAGRHEQVRRWNNVYI